MMDGTTIAGGLVALLHTVISDHAGYPQPIIGKNFTAAFRLRHPVFVRCSPSLHRGFISEKR